MFVYRLETETGEGVFSCGAAWEYDDHKHGRARGAYNPPGPHNEKQHTELYKFTTDYSVEKFKYRFAFQSKRHLLKWFGSTKGRNAIANQVAVSVYEVSKEHVYQGQWQCVFFLPEAKFVEKLHPATLEPLPVEISVSARKTKKKG